LPPSIGHRRVPSRWAEAGIARGARPPHRRGRGLQVDGEDEMSRTDRPDVGATVDAGGGQTNLAATFLAEDAG